MKIKRIVLKKGFWNKRTREFTFWKWQWYASKEDLDDEELVRHANIHTAGYNDLLVIFFIPLYVLLAIFNALVNLDPYFENIFEREAFIHQSDPSYLKTRKMYAWFKYIGTKRRKNKRGVPINNEL